MCFGQQGKKINPVRRCPSGLESGYALTHLRDPRLALSLLGQHPAAQDSPPCQVFCKPLLSTQRDRCLYPLLGCLPLPALLMALGSPK